jgi:hypothetical protein
MANVPLTKATFFQEEGYERKDSLFGRRSSGGCKRLLELGHRFVEFQQRSFDGELYGSLPAGHKFAKLQFGMGQKEVMDTVGHPTDQKTYVTGKAWIPFYFGGDRWRHEMFYKGDGRLVFAGGSGYGQVGYLLKIIVDPKESGYAR